MIDFHPITADDSKWASPILRSGRYMCCAFSFVTQFMWSLSYKTDIALHKGSVALRSESGPDYWYLWPVGEGDAREIIEDFREDARANGKGMVLYSVTLEDKDRIEEWFPGQFEISTNRDDSDYLYEQTDLATLGGRRFQKKRNHVSRFIRENPDWEFHRLTQESLAEVRAFNDAWSQLDGNREDAGVQDEHRAIDLLFDNFEKLDMQGGYITAGGRIVAYSMGSAVNQWVFDTNVEKGLYEVTGSYNIINREMAAQVCEGFKLINREDDVGDEGLRTAKLSYNPAIIEPKYQARWRG